MFPYTVKDNEIESDIRNNKLLYKRTPQMPKCFRTFTNKKGQFRNSSHISEFSFIICINYMPKRRGRQLWHFEQVNSFSVEHEHVLRIRACLSNTNRNMLAKTSTCLPSVVQRSVPKDVRQQAPCPHHEFVAL